LTGMHSRSPVDIELCHRRRNLGRDGGFLLGKQNSFRRYDLSQGRRFHLPGLDGDDRLYFRFLIRARRKGEQRQRSRKRNSDTRALSRSLLHRRLRICLPVHHLNRSIEIDNALGFKNSQSASAIARSPPDTAPRRHRNCCGPGPARSARRRPLAPWPRHLGTAMSSNAGSPPPGSPTASTSPSALAPSPPRDKRSADSPLPCAVPRSTARAPSRAAIAPASPCFALHPSRTPAGSGLPQTSTRGC